MCLWQYRWDLVKTIRSRYWILDFRIEYVVNMWCRGVLGLDSLVIWTLGNLVVGPGARLVVSVLVSEPLYIGLARVVVIRRSWVK